MSLLDLQRELAKAVRIGQAPTAEMAAGVRVYANNHRGQLQAALYDTFEKSAQWVGEEAFAALTQAYIDACPSTSWNLSHYGQSFPEFAGALRPNDPVTEELAWLDWALRSAFDGRDADSLSMDEAKPHDWEAVVFEFVPTLHYRWTHTNAAAIWAALASGLPVPEENHDLDRGLRVWRDGLSPRFATMPPLEAHALDFALAGATWGELCAWLVGQLPEDDVARTAGGLLRAWLSEGCVKCLVES